MTILYSCTSQWEITGEGRVQNMPLALYFFTLNSNQKPTTNYSQTSMCNHLLQATTSLPGKHISPVISVPYPGLIIVFPYHGKHISLAICVPLPKKHISLVIHVPKSHNWTETEKPSLALGICEFHQSYF